MAKKTTKGASLDDFFEENLDLTETEEEQEETQEEEQDEQEEKEEKKKPQPKGKKKDEEETDESEEDEPEKKPKSKEKEKPKKVEKEEETESEKEEESEEEQEEDEPSEVDPKAFFEEVDKITGMSVDVDFGDKDPLTPEGIAIREKAVREDALDTFLTEIEEKHPQAFKALQHAYNGGNIADLFKEITTRDYSKVELKDEDEALATEILKEYYQSKGIKSEARIKKLIETAQDSEEGLVGEARPLLEEMQAEQAEKQQKTAEEQKKVAAEARKKETLLVGAIDEVLEKGILSTFKLQPKEGKEFRNFIHSSVTKINDKYTFKMEVEPANLEKQLQYLYFQFKKGNLQDLVQIKKETQNTEKLRLRIKSEQAAPKKSTEQEKKSNWSLKDYEE